MNSGQKPYLYDKVKEVEIEIGPAIWVYTLDLEEGASTCSRQKIVACMKFAKISCTRKFPVLQFQDLRKKQGVRLANNTEMSLKVMRDIYAQMWNTWVDRPHNRDKVSVHNRAQTGEISVTNLKLCIQDMYISVTYWNALKLLFLCKNWHNYSQLQTLPFKSILKNF